MQNGPFECTVKCCFDIQIREKDFALFTPHSSVILLHSHCMLPLLCSCPTHTRIGSPPGKQNSGMIAGVVIAVLLLVIALTATLIVIVWMIWRYRRNGKLDSCDMVSCCTCSCWSTCARVKNISIPLKRRHYPNANGSSAKPRFRDDDVEVQVYSSVQKPARGVDSPPPLPPQTLTEMELDDLMNPDYVESPSPTHEKPSRRNTALSVYSQSGATPKLVKVSKLKKFKMKENPIYLSSDEIEAGDCDEKLDDAVYALPSKKTASHSNSIRSDASEPIYSEAINPTMFTKRASTLVTDDNLHPYGPVYARPLMQKSRQPLEIEEENIREIKQIGVGQFGAVILAEMSGLKSSDVNLLPQDVVSEDGVTLVAVKRLKLDVSNEIRQSFDKEIKFMSQLEHENIVQLLAVCMQRDNPFIVMEYMENGDLNQFLQRYQIVNDDAALHLNQIPSSVLQYMAIQIASGMCYLASLNYVHRDLATRNCLVGSNFRIKISDFGMSRNLYERVYYRVRGRAMLPIRWMATESFYGRFSEKSDVWAYGVAVWEIFTLGKKQPYEELDDQEMIQDAIRGTGRRILKKPEGCPQDVYKVLLRCWEYAAEDRTTFKDIRDSLLSIQQDS